MGWLTRYHQCDWYAGMEAKMEASRELVSVFLVSKGLSPARTGD